MHDYLPTGDLVRLVLLTLLVIGSTSPALADEAAIAADEALMQQLEERIMQRLREGPWLQQQIEQGILAHERKKAEAQRAARARQERLKAEKAKAVRPADANRDHIQGNPEATISLIEYSDFECPYCKRFHPTPKQVLDSYGDSVNWIYRHYPLPFHNPGAQKQAEASECASELGGNAAFWKYTDAIYTKTRSGGRGFPLEQLVPLAEELGLERQPFEECLDSGRYAARVKEDLDEGRAIGVTGTPATILRNNKTGAVSVKSGAVSVAVFKTEIDKLLEPSAEEKK
ncbi:MAG: DsbA family protein [Gammaproteobacteria bacterium]|nr:DsbA family protein [Gammaproteobacteria bacterium]